MPPFRLLPVLLPVIGVLYSNLDVGRKVGALSRVLMSVVSVLVARIELVGSKFRAGDTQLNMPVIMEQA